MVVERGEEPLLTSVLPIVRLPDEISFYEYEGENKKFEQAIENSSASARYALSPTGELRCRT